MLDLYKKRMGYNSSQKYDYGSSIREQNREIFESTFDSDAAYIICKINDQPVEARFYYGSSGDVNKDEPRFNLQFHSGEHYPIGTLISIEEEEFEESEYTYWEREDINDRPCYIENGVHYRRWMIVNKTKELQFRKYYILPCDWCLKWICDGKLYKQVGVMRIRSSYSSGIRERYQLTVMEAQDGIWVPMNEKVATLGMDQRIMMGDYMSLHPQTYKVTDYYTNHPIGICKLTLYRTELDPSDDTVNLIANGRNFVDASSEDVIADETFNITHNITLTHGKTSTLTAHHYVNAEEIDITLPIKWYVLHDASDPAYQTVIDNVSIVGSDDTSILKIKCENKSALINKKVIVRLYIGEEMKAESIYKVK